MHSYKLNTWNLTLMIEAFCFPILQCGIIFDIYLGTTPSQNCTKCILSGWQR